MSPTPLLPNPVDPGSLAQRYQVYPTTGPATMYNPIVVGNAYISAVTTNGAELRIATSNPNFGSNLFPIATFSTGSSLETTPGWVAAALFSTGGGTQGQLEIRPPAMSGNVVSMIEMFGTSSDGTTQLSTVSVKADDVTLSTQSGGASLAALAANAPNSGSSYAGAHWHMVAVDDRSINANVPVLQGSTTGILDCLTKQFYVQMGSTVVTLSGTPLSGNVIMPTVFHTSTDCVVVTNGNVAANPIIPGVAVNPSTSMFTVVDIAATASAGNCQINWIAWGH